MDDLYIYLVILFLILVILFISIYISITNKKQTSSFSIYNLKHGNDPNYNWHDPVAVSGCQLYTFPNNNILAPTTDKSILDVLPFNNNLLSIDGCVDQDQVYVQLSTRLCGANNEATCVGYDGVIYQAGQFENFYNYCPNTYCTNSIIGAIATNFNYNPNDTNGGFLNTLCLSHNGNANDIVVGKTCDINDNTQYFRIYRATAPINPTFDNNPTIDITGQFLRIVQRDTNLCVSPESNSQDSNLVLKNCLSLPNNGYVWLLIPSLANNISVFPQQILYTNGTFMPVNIKFDNIFDILSTFSSYSILGDNNQNTIKLSNWAFNFNNNKQNTQIIDKRIYPIMSGNFNVNPKYPPSSNPNTFINFQYYSLPPTT